MDEEEAELRNPFPSPPSHYANYTSHNLKLLALLKERTSDTDLSTHNEHDILSDQTDLPPWPLAQLEKPRVDWIIEDGYYNVYGDTWFVRAAFTADTRTVLRLPIRSKKLSHL
jgi:mediator of RNA polymerase II transcription subunit 7